MSEVLKVKITFMPTQILLYLTITGIPLSYNENTLSSSVDRFTILDLVVEVMDLGYILDCFVLLI